MSVLNLIRPELLDLPIYRGDEEAKYRLHANELPWSPIEKTSYNCYPCYQQQIKFHQQLANYYGIEEKQLVLTRGSDDGIDLLTRLFLTARKDAFLYFPPTFSMYAFYVRVQQAELVECPLDKNNNFSLSLEQIRNSWQSNCKIIMLCNPNNPTGNLVSLEFIASACEHYRNRSLIVVDESYIEFTDKPSAVSLINRFDNLVILRTLSKAYGLAGIRLGSIVAQASTIEAINKITAPYTIPTPSLDLAQQALRDKQWFIAAIKKIRIERDKLQTQLRKLACVEKIYPSETNFILIKTIYAQKIADYLTENNIAIRQFPPNSLLHQHLRITIGSEEQNSLLIKLLFSFNKLTIRV